MGEEVNEEREQALARGAGAPPYRDELRAVVREVMGEFVSETKRTEALEQRVNELIAENQEALRSTTIRAELQRLGVAKIELAYKAIKDDVSKLTPGGEELREYLKNFVGENPELLPARMSGGSGATSAQRGSGAAEGIDLASIRPGMSAEELDRVRKEVARVASQTLKGWQ